jgi:apolipoprotein N-acyltransferase
MNLAWGLFRAFYNRRYLVRAATTGNSAVIDPYGRVVGTLAPGTTGVLAAKVAGRSTLTPYVRWGDGFGFLCVVLAGMALLGQPGQLAHRRFFALHAPAVS